MRMGREGEIIPYNSEGEGVLEMVQLKGQKKTGDNNVTLLKPSVFSCQNRVHRFICLDLCDY